MSEDRTVPMQQPQWSRRETDPDEQETVYADQESVTPPTMPFKDQSDWQTPPSPDPMSTDPSVKAPARPYSPPQPPARPSGPQTPAGPEAQTMMISERPTPTFAWLVVVDGPDRNTVGSVHTLHPDTTTLGRVPANQIVLRDETVSAQHARIRHEVKEGQEPVFALFDLGSRNGIYAGDQETYRNEENRVYRHELRDGDYLLVGETTLVFKKV
jgi:hypothetical protein